MPVLTTMPRFYATIVQKHDRVCAMLVGIASIVLASSIRRGHARQAIAYLLAVAISVVLIDAIALARRARAAPLPVRRPRLESMLLAVCWAMAMGWLIQRFVFDYRPASPPARLVWVGAGLGSVFAIIPALFFLARRYWPADLGLRLSGIVSALPVFAVFAAITLTCSRGSMTWTEIVRQYGALDIVLIAISAALPEEFFRVAWQTRIGAWAGSRAAGWLIASIAWALLHGPKDFSESHSLMSAAIDVIDIVPLGLLWGYLTHRTGSFVPSLLLHGTNFWGLQNL